jgi:hypothetical protein
MTSERTRQGLALLGSAIAFGVAADVLARAVPGRLDTALGLCALVLIAAFLVQRGLVPMPPRTTSLGLPFGLLTVALIWRDSAALFAMNLLGIAILAVLATPRLRRVGWSRAGVLHYPRGALQLAGGAMAGAAPLVFNEIDWRSLPESGPLHRLRGVAVGLLAVSPVAAVLGGLLMDADPVFHSLMVTTFSVELDWLASHAVPVFLWSWLAAGALRLFFRSETDPVARRDQWRGRFGLTEVGVALGVLDLLFLSFVAVQFRHLFGATGLSHSEYAREGFFQLVAVASLSLPVLLIADHALGPRDPATRRRFVLLASLMVGLLYIMLASALWRMRLYTAEYGLTELRFYTTAFMGWLVLVFGWLAATILRGRRRRFGAGALTAAFLVLAVLNLANPDSIIARTNLTRGLSGKSVDAHYLASLSADALPTIERMLPLLPGPGRTEVASVLGPRWESEYARGSRWTIAYARARGNSPPVR